MNIPEPHSTEGCNILVVDDTRSNIQLLTGILEKAGHTVRTASSSEEALNLINAEPSAITLLHSASLAASETKYRLFFDNAHDAILIIDALSHKILEVNRMASEKLGYTHTELMSLSLPHLFSPEESQHAAERIAGMMTQERITFETEQQCKDGSCFPAEVIARNIAWDGQPAILSIHRDITRRKMAEQESKKYLLLLKSCIESHTDTFLFSVDRNYRYIYFNQTYADIMKYAYNRDIKLGMSILECISSEADRKAAREECDRALEGESCSSIRAYGDFNQSWYEIVVNPILNAAHEIIGAAALGRDITDRLRTEAEKAEIETQNRHLQKVKSLSCMAGAIAHHFNNHLQTVMGNMEMAVMDLPPGSNASKKLDKAMDASRRAGEITRLLLTYLGQAPGRHEPLDLSKICSQSLSILHTMIPDKTIAEPEFPLTGPVIQADFNHMQQVLINLVMNAHESLSDHQGSIRLKVSTAAPSEIPAMHRFPVGWQPQDAPHACMEITDTGCGVSDADIDKIFDPFFSSKFTGRGLGLPVAIGIVQAHGGGITVESKPGKGSVFRVFLPVSDEGVPQPVEEWGYVRDKDNAGTILLAEDEAHVRDMVRNMLTYLGFTVLEAGDGAGAVEIFRQHREKIRCVLTDLTMPHMNGWETLAAIRSLSPETPVILASGYDEDKVMAGEHPDRPDAFLGKPYLLKTLGDTIHKVLAVKPAN